MIKNSRHKLEAKSIFYCFVVQYFFFSLRLKNDRKRQEKLAQERLFARQDRKRNKPDEEDATSYTEPPKGSCLDIINTRIYNL